MGSAPARCGEKGPIPSSALFTSKILLCATGIMLIPPPMCYQIAKEIGAAATVLEGRVDVIFLTGGLAHGKMIVDEISRRVSFIAPIRVYPGEFEMEALAQAGMRVLKGEEEALEY